MIPKTFELLGSTWTVKKVKNLCDADGDKLHGYCHTDKRLIEIDASEFEDTDSLLHTFHHELNHAIWFVAGFDFWHDDDKADLDAGLRAQFEKTSKGRVK